MEKRKIKIGYVKIKGVLMYVSIASAAKIGTGCH